MPDIYDAAIDYLCKHPEKRASVWCYPRGHQYGALFAFCTPDGTREAYEFGQDKSCGCVTMIKCRPDRYEAYDPAVTRNILNDPQVPDDISVETTREQLEAVAEHQRCMDQWWPGRYEKLTGPEWLDEDEEQDIANESGG